MVHPHCLLLTSLIIAGAASMAAAQTQSWILFEDERLFASDPAIGQQFARALSLDGDTLAIGARESVYVFERSGDTWLQSAKLVASDGGSSDRFGTALALSGKVLVVGAFEDDDMGVDSGSAYVFVKGAAQWQQQAKLTAGFVEPMNFFGAAVAVSGSTIAVGAPHSFPTTLSGAVHVFERQATGWVERQRIEPSDGRWEDFFGSSVAMHGDVLIAGSPGYESSGAAYVYARSASGWQFSTKLEPEADAGHVGFGMTASLSGKRAACGAYVSDHLGGDSGSVYVFSQAPGTWFLEDLLLQADGGVGCRFGGSVALHGDRLVASAERSVGFSSPSAHVFEYDGVGWNESFKLKRSHFSSGSDKFATALAIRSDLVLVGDSRATSDLASNPGAIFRYTLPAARPQAFCPGDGSLAPCPCGNESDVGAGEGCLNSSGEGAILTGAGSLSVVADDLELYAWHLALNQPALLLAAAAATSGQTFGDGLLCIGGVFERLGVERADHYGRAKWGSGLGAGGSWVAGDTRFFQIWYRDPVAGPCGKDSNLSSALEVPMLP